jgi:hypothetical protein
VGRDREARPSDRGYAERSARPAVGEDRPALIARRLARSDPAPTAPKAAHSTSGMGTAIQRRLLTASAAIAAK